MNQKQLQQQGNLVGTALQQQSGYLSNRVKRIVAPLASLTLFVLFLFALKGNGESVTTFEASKFISALGASTGVTGVMLMCL